MTPLTYRHAGLALVLVAVTNVAVATDRDGYIRNCVSERSTIAGDAVTIGELRQECSQEFDTAGPQGADATVVSPVEVRQKIERRDVDQRFSLLAHRPTYLLPYTYNRKVNQGLMDQNGPLEKPKRTEAGFQVSFKAPVWRDILGTGDNLFLAFTNRSFWQLYDRPGSSPFRTSDYEPELFWRHYGDAEFGPVSITGFDIGVSHQSNGRSRPLSRSWNRVVGSTVLNIGNVALDVRGWLRLPESDEDDDNPDIEDYMGYGEFRLIYAPDRNTFTLMTRPANNGGAIELTWSHELTRSVRFYMQYYNGFGETLIDYDHRAERISLGIALNDFLVGND